MKVFIRYLKKSHYETQCKTNTYIGRVNGLEKNISFFIDISKYYLIFDKKETTMYNKKKFLDFYVFFGFLFFSIIYLSIDKSQIISIINLNFATRTKGFWKKLKRMCLDTTLCGRHKMAKSQLLQKRRINI